MSLTRINLRLNGLSVDDRWCIRCDSVVTQRLFLYRLFLLLHYWLGSSCKNYSSPSDNPIINFFKDTIYLHLSYRTISNPMLGGSKCSSKPFLCISAHFCPFRCWRRYFITEFLLVKEMGLYDSIQWLIQKIHLRGRRGEGGGKNCGQRHLMEHWGDFF